MSDILDISGFWMEEDRRFVKIEQEGNNFTATCTYKNDKGIRVVWRAEGNVGKNRIDCELIHEQPSIFANQARRATVVDDRMVGSVFIDGSLFDKFEWNRAFVDDMSSFVPGHLSIKNLDRLTLEAEKVGREGGSIVEVGRLFGKSTVALAYGLLRVSSTEKVFSIDNGSGIMVKDTLLGVDFGGLTPKLPNRMKVMSCGDVWESYTSGLVDNIVRIDGDSKDMLPRMLNGASLVFLDGDHTEEGFRSDLSMVLQCDDVKTLICHDWGHPEYSIKEVCSEFLSEPDDLLGTMAIWNIK